MVNDNNYVVADLIADWLEKNDIKKEEIDKKVENKKRKIWWIK